MECVLMKPQDKFFYEHAGCLLQTLRITQGIARKDAARMLNMPESRLQNIECGNMEITAADYYRIHTVIGGKIPHGTCL